MENNHYEVIWTSKMLGKLFAIYNVNHDAVYRRSMHSLATQPKTESLKSANYPGYRFNGCHLAMYNNVLLVYSVNESKKQVVIRACVYGGSGLAAQILYGIEPDED